MQDYCIVSFSGGKDSTAMLLRLLELKQQIDEVIYCDVGKEFPQMYRHVEKVQQLVENHNIKFTILKNELDFDYFMFEHKPKRKNPEKFQAMYGNVPGYSFPTFRNRWCTSKLKIDIIHKYLQQLRSKHTIKQYVGIAFDEQERLERKNNQNPECYFPLVEWGWTEADCLNYCYSLGFDWEGLYEIFNRVSCWCCPLQPLEELRKLYKHFPQLWEELKEMQLRTWQTFKPDYTVQDLDLRFQLEEQYITEGKNIKSKEFFAKLKNILNKNKT